MFCLLFRNFDHRMLLRIALQCHSKHLFLFIDADLNHVRPRWHELHISKHDGWSGISGFILLFNRNLQFRNVCFNSCCCGCNNYYRTGTSTDDTMCYNARIMLLVNHNDKWDSIDRDGMLLRSSLSGWKLCGVNYCCSGSSNNDQMRDYTGEMLLLNDDDFWDSIDCHGVLFGTGLSKLSL